MKTCSKCGLEKPIELFVKNKDQCKDCKSAYLKAYRIENQSRLQESDKARYQANREQILEQKSEYYQENRAQILEKVKAHALDHKDEKREYQRDYERARRTNDPGYKLRTNISRSINRVLTHNASSKNGESVLQYLPYSLEELYRHIETQFESWMTWSNQGVYKVDEWDDNDPTTWRWQLDHIIPHSTFQYTSMDSQEFQECWALSNLRPLSAKQNQLDGATKLRHH